ncbi:monooxygenase [Catenulispora subtropica]|uniref:FAD binding domain-containing protein n=1 Tax=Catenulispora subtropica TaxID=450798 RepID=A0ABP5CR94_9ACTN
MTRAARIAVVGGSIAGCAGALAAAEAAPQASVVVFERSAGALRDRGAGIAIHRDRFAELAAAGFLDASLPGFHAESRRWYTREGAAEVPAMGKPLAAHPFPFTSHNWGQLYRYLRERLPERVEYRPDTRIVEVKPTPSGAELTLADGGSESFDLVLGADGYRSVVREAMFPGITPEYAGYLCWRGLGDMNRIKGLPEEAFFTVGIATGHLIAYPIPADEDGGTRLNWALFSTVPPELTPDFTTATSLPPGAVSESLLDHLETLISTQLPPFWADAVRTTAREDVFIQPMYDLQAPAFAQGRLLLIGDSGAVSRPHAAAGALKALQDAAALADLWRQTPDATDVAGLDGLDGLARRYDAVRRPAGHAVVALSRRIGQAQVRQVPDWAAFGEAELSAWQAALTQAPDGTIMGGRPL